MQIVYSHVRESVGRGEEETGGERRGRGEGEKMPKSGNGDSCLHILVTLHWLPGS